MLTPLIGYKKDRYVATIDIPNFFIQTPIDSKPVEGVIIMKIKGVLVVGSLPNGYIRSVPLPRIQVPGRRTDNNPAYSRVRAT